MVRGSIIKLENTEIIKEVNTSVWTLEFGFNEYLRYCRIKNLRERTIKGYIECYNKFICFINEHTTHIYVDELNKADIENYVLYLRSTGISEVSVNTYLRPIRALLNFYYEQEVILPIKVPITKADKATKATYNDIELTKLLYKPNIRKCSFVEYRNWCIINTLLSTGIRVSTLVSIQIQDLEFDMNKLYLAHTKSRKGYFIPISSQLKEVLIEYCTYRKGNSEDYLFCNQYGEPMTTDSVKQAIKKYNLKHGVLKTSVHAFRHTYAKKCVLNNVNVFALQKLMGHSDIKVTKEYVDLYAEDLAVNINQYNPLDTLHASTTKQESNKTTTRKRLSVRC